MRDASTGKLVDTDHGKTYVEGCGNSNTFITDCTAGVIEAGTEPTCPSKREDVLRGQSSGQKQQNRSSTWDTAA